MSPQKPWSGRFSQSTDELLEKLSVSVHFDKRLYSHDILGSQAHARMLGRVGLVSEEESTTIIEGLDVIKEQIEKNVFNWNPKLEDVHMNIESALIALIGDVGAKLHTARSRNDQVALDERLYLRERVHIIGHSLQDLRKKLSEKALNFYAAPMPGYTHLQRAQPVTVGHHLLAYYEMLTRDQGRLKDLTKRLEIMPLGSGALSGTGLPIDPSLVAFDLDFLTLSNNSLDAVSSRDHLLEFMSFAAILMVNLSRLAEDLILWCSQEFGFAELPDKLSTGSSMMPQKKNPDGAELMRGKSGRVIGNLVSLLAVLKGLPLSYNRDLQEDKEPLFDTIDTLDLVLPLASVMIEGLDFNLANLKKAADDPYTAATDLADHLVLKGLPFRKAHEVAGQVVAYALKEKKALTALTMLELNRFSPLISSEVLTEMTLENLLKARKTPGGTAPDKVKEAALKALKEIEVEI